MAPRSLSGLLAKFRAAQAPGRSGETMACHYLERSGFVILTRNYRCRSGEVDVVAMDRGETVFVEVKERHGVSHGEGHEAVTFGKRRRIIRAARLYAASKGLTEAPMRFDVVSIDWTGTGPRIRHDRGAFDGEGS